MKKKKRWIPLKIFLLLIVLILLGFVSPLQVDKYDLTFSKLPKEFDGYKIIQISDFHCKEFGTNQDSLIKMVKKASPDLILLTGDIVDEEHTVDEARYLLEGIKEIAPVYYITGNHEYYDGAPYDEFCDICYENGVTILENESVEIEKDGASIELTGVDFHSYLIQTMKEKIGYADESKFNILMYHDASRFNYLSEFGYDLIFTGHIHGGLVRIPFKGGVFASDYTFFPTYDKGIYNDKNSTMVVSTGLGDARIPRWNNPRECVLVTLHSTQE